MRYFVFVSYINCYGFGSGFIYMIYTLFICLILLLSPYVKHHPIVRSFVVFFFGLEDESNL